MATFNVTNSNDSGSGSLREAVQLANGEVGTDTILLETDVNLSSAIEITDSLYLGTPYGATITQTGAGRIFTIDDSDRETNINVDLFRLSLVGGNSVVEGGAIYNAENLRIVDSHIYDNFASIKGGAIYNTNGNLYISSSIIEENQVNNGFYASTMGGGLYVNSGNTIINSSIVKGNRAIEGSSIAIAQNAEVATYNTTFDNDFTKGSVSIRNSRLEMSNSIIKGNALISEYKIIDDWRSELVFDELTIDTGYNYQDNYFATVEESFGCSAETQLRELTNNTEPFA